MNKQAEALKARTSAFATMVIELCERAPQKQSTRIITKQLIEAATSVAANYRAACRSRSRAEFVAKIGVVVEEADECCGWLDMLVDTKALEPKQCEPARKEADELTAIFTASYKTAKGKAATPRKPSINQSPNQSEI